MDKRFLTDRFPRTSAYHPEWILAGASGGANPLWLTEWLTEELDLRPNMKVLDLGCGRALSSIFLHREFDVQVWSTDLWFSATENIKRVEDAGVADGVFPVRADAHSLPYAEDFFDAIVCIDSFMYFGTDEMYLNDLARFVKPGGLIAIAQAGFTREMGDTIPAHLSEWWAAENPFCLHSADWWRQHWTKTGILDVTLADTMSDGWKFWRDWLKIIAPDNQAEIQALETDEGRNFAYIRAVGKRRPEAQLFDPAMSFPSDYTRQPLLRSSD